MPKRGPGRATHASRVECHVHSRRRAPKFHEYLHRLERSLPKGEPIVFAPFPERGHRLFNARRWLDEL